MKNKIIVATFLLVLYGFFFSNLFTPALEVSYNERRYLKQMPPLTIENILNAQFMTDFDAYSVDQFVMRDQFRILKTAVNNTLFGKLETNDLFSYNNHLLKIEYPLNENSITGICKKINNIQNMYLQNMNVYYSIVPDKNYYLPQNNKYLIMDYNKLETLMNDNLPSMKYINLYNSLQMDDYYTTDSHWRQEKLQNVVETLGAGLDVNMHFDIADYIQKSYEPYYGVYYGQAARVFKPDTLIWLENDSILNTVVTSVNPNMPNTVYHLDKLGSMDSYEVFLAGVQPIITLQNPNNLSGKSLIIFRDSYASSLAPLMLEGYSNITLIDLRYVKSPILSNYIDFNDQDVLFLYSTTIINNSSIID